MVRSIPAPLGSHRSTNDGTRHAIPCSPFSKLVRSKLEDAGANTDDVTSENVPGVVGSGDARTGTNRYVPSGAIRLSGALFPVNQEADGSEGTIMWWIGGILGLIILIAIAFWPARVAGRKGHSFILYFILSLIFFPLALILAYVVEDRTAITT